MVTDKNRTGDQGWIINHDIIGAICTGYSEAIFLRPLLNQAVNRIPCACFVPEFSITFGSWIQSVTAPIVNRSVRML